MASKSQDLDLFLTGVESKLRGPFSSLDLTKTMTTPALRGPHLASETDYLHQVSQVVARTDKIIQMRILLSFLGLDNEPPELNAIIYHILQKAQGKKDELLGEEEDEDVDESQRLALRFEEWVRILAGLVQGIMFCEDPEDKNTKSTGEEAQQLLDTTCDKIIQSVQELSREVVLKQQKNASKGDKKSGVMDTTLYDIDVDPLLSPYKYALLNPEALKRVMPEALPDEDANPNPHFKVNKNARIISMDLEMEAQKAQEEAEHELQKTAAAAKRGAKGAGNAANNAAASAPMAIMPGLRAPSASSKPKSNAPARPKTSMFLTRKPVAAAAAGGPQRKKGLHVRRAGAAQGLVGKSRQVQGGGAPGAASAGALGGNKAGTMKDSSASRFGGAARRAAAAAASGRSKMKLLDDSDMDNLNNQPRESTIAALNGKSSKLLGKRNRGAAARAAAKAPKIEKTSTAGAAAAATAASSRNEDHTHAETAAPPAASPTAGALAAAALSMYQSQVGLSTAAPAPAAPRQLDWRQLLAEKSNRLADDDRQRVQQFFEDRSNPGAESVYKMKLHEERTTDPNTGEPVKETYYLELDYTTFTSKQSKKVKRYKD